MCLIACSCYILHKQLLYREKILTQKQSKLTIAIRLTIVSKASRGIICGSIQTDLKMLKSRSLDEIIVRCCTFYLAVRCALLIALTLLGVTCTVERSFSTLIREKTWLRKFSGEDCISVRYYFFSTFPFFCEH